MAGDTRYRLSGSAKGVPKHTMQQVGRRVGEVQAAVRAGTWDGGDAWVLTGTKIFVTNGVEADVLIIYARTEAGSTGSRGISAFIVTKEASDLGKVKGLGIGHDDSLTPMAGFRAGKKEDEGYLPRQQGGFQAAGTCFGR